MNISETKNGNDYRKEWNWNIPIFSRIGLVVLCIMIGFTIFAFQLATPNVKLEVMPKLYDAQFSVKEKELEIKQKEYEIKQKDEKIKELESKFHFSQERESKYQTDISKLESKYQTDISKLESKYQTDISKLESKYQTDILSVHKEYRQVSNDNATMTYRVQNMLTQLQQAKSDNIELRDVIKQQENIVVDKDKVIKYWISEALKTKK